MPNSARKSLVLTVTRNQIAREIGHVTNVQMFIDAPTSEQKPRLFDLTSHVSTLIISYTSVTTQEPCETVILLSSMNATP